MLITNFDFVYRQWHSRSKTIKD